MSHRSIRPVLACSLVLALSGCQFGSTAEQINAALPPGTEFLTAKDKLLAAAKAQAVDAKAIEADLDARMAQRATGCAGDFKAGVFDSDDAIREKLATLHREAHRELPGGVFGDEFFVGVLRNGSKGKAPHLRGSSNRMERAGYFVSPTTPLLTTTFTSTLRALALLPLPASAATPMPSPCCTRPGCKPPVV